MHSSIVRYDIALEDGIYIQCTCGWEKTLGNEPSVIDIYHAWFKHLSAVRKDNEIRTY